MPILVVLPFPPNRLNHLLKAIQEIGALFFSEARALAVDGALLA